MINFAKRIIDQSQSYPTKIAYRDGTNDLTYGELIDRIPRVAQGLIDQGLQQGNHVIITMEDCVDWPVVFLACLYNGIIPLPLSTAMGQDLFASIAEFVKCKKIIAGDAVASRLGNQIPIITRTQVREFYLKSFESIAPTMMHPDSAAWMNVSSGSTGMPKVAVHRHQTLFEMLRMSPGPSFGMTRDSVILSTPKLSWNYGLHNSITYTLGLGATAILIPEAPAGPTVFEYINRYQPNIVISSPSIIRRLLATNTRYTLPTSVKHFNSSGEHLPKPMYDQFLKRFGIPLHSCIGMMETASNYAANPDWEHDPGTVGRAFDGVKIKLVDDEIYVSSPANACYYYNNYQKTQDTFVGEWVRTGDRGYYNKLGNLVFAGRVDDVFKVNDLIVNPIEIEAEIMQHPAVEQAAVSGVVNANGLKDIHACVTLRYSLDVNELKTYLQQKLFPHQVPKQIHIVETFPETMTNKKDRRTMAQELHATTL
jgi:benzoate-CoA ligase